MKRIAMAFGVLALSIFLTACANESGQSPATGDQAGQQANAKGDAHGHEEADHAGHEHTIDDAGGSSDADGFKEREGLYFNGGKKWVVNPEMRPHIEGAERWLDEQLKQGMVDPVKLAEGLKSYNTKLVKSCTMEGESHDVLHEWLHPHMALIEDLAKSEDKAETEKHIASIMRSFALYNRYFE